MKRILLALACALFLAATPLAAQERILSYDTEIQVNADGTLDVSERIRVRAEGNQIRRGIYRTFPTRYRDRYGNRVRVAFEVLGVERDGRPEAWFTERMSNGVRVNTGGDELLRVPADYEFVLRYRTDRQLGFFEEQDELYWNAIGADWVFAIESGSVRVRLPEPVPIERMAVEAYTGPQGARGRDYVAELPEPGLALYRLSAPLAPREAFTIVLSFPKGVVEEPSRAQRTRWLLADNRGLLVALAALALLLCTCALRWHQVGRDPRPGTIIARYEPSAGWSPAGLRYLRRMSYDLRCFTADLLALAVAGRLCILREGRKAWTLERIGASSEGVSAAQRALLEKLFPKGRRTLELDTKNAAQLSGAQAAHGRELRREFQPDYFRSHVGSVLLALAIALGGSALALGLSGGNGIPAIAVVVALMLAAVVVFARLVRAPTPRGRALLDELEGLRLYMSVAERDELAAMQGPDAPPALDAARYEALLPFAIALDVEEAWTQKLTAALGSAAATAAAAHMSWYRGDLPLTSLTDFTRDVGSSLSTVISAASTPPGSSSGSSGGGSSGGGGGGGGGGGR